MSIFSSSPDTAEDAAADPRPAGQRDRAEHAHLNPNEPAKDAEAGTPQYGSFGKPSDVDAAATKTPNNDGNNDNPDEFSEFRKPNASGTEDYSPETAGADPTEQRGHVTQNQDPQAVRASQNADADVQGAAWAQDDPRYAGGHATPTWQEENNKEHGSND